MDPETIGRYEVQGILGQGMMGVVYKTLDPMLGRFSAIKVMHTGGEMDEELRARFFQEARSAGQLNHPNIISIYDVGEDNSQAFIAMELVEGEDLKTVINKRVFVPFREKLRFVRDICQGLDYAHEMGVVHRDIKPGNVFITQKGGVKILDFGLARLASSDMTRTGMVMGSPYYMSPEQVKGLPDIDGRSDLFSAGVVLYELLTFAKPFEADSPTAVCFKIVTEPHRPLAESLPGCDPELVETIDRALAKDKEGRFQCGADFAEQLLDFEEHRLADAQEVLKQDIQNLGERLRSQGQEANSSASSDPAEQTVMVGEMKVSVESSMKEYPSDPDDYGSLLARHGELVQQLEKLGDNWDSAVLRRGTRATGRRAPSRRPAPKAATSGSSTSSSGMRRIEVPASSSGSFFRFAKAKIPDPARRLRAGQMVALTRGGDEVPLAAEVKAISESQIVLELLVPVPDRPVQDESKIQVKYWDEDQAVYLDAEVQRVSGAFSQRIEITRPEEGHTLVRPKVWKFHDALQFSFKVMEAEASQLAGKRVRDCQAESVSAHGLEFQSELPLTRQDKLEVTLELPPSQQIQLVGTVSRVEQREEDSLNTVVLSFGKLAPEAHNTLILFLNQSRPKQEHPDWA